MLVLLVRALICLDDCIFFLLTFKSRMIFIISDFVVIFFAPKKKIPRFM